MPRILKKVLELENGKTQADDQDFSDFISGLERRGIQSEHEHILDIEDAEQIVND